MSFSLRKSIVFLATAALLHGFTATAQDLFRANFSVRCRTTDENGQLTSARITERDIIRSLLGTNESSSSIRRNYVLVYNQTADSLQAVQLVTGEVLGDVLLFDGGNFTSDSRTSERLTFVFLPGQNDAIGTAILTQRFRDNEGTTNRVRITGKLQFVLSDGQTLGGQPVTEEDTNGAPVVTDPGLTNGIGLTNVSGITDGTTTTNVTIGTGTGAGFGSVADTNLLALTPLVPGSTGVTVETNRLLLTPALPGVTAGTATGATNTLGTTNITGTVTNGTGTGVVGDTSGTATNATNTAATPVAANPDVSVCTATFSAGRRVTVGSVNRSLFER